MALKMWYKPNKKPFISFSQFPIFQVYDYVECKFWKLSMLWCSLTLLSYLLCFGVILCYYWIIWRFYLFSPSIWLANICTIFYFGLVLFAPFKCYLTQSIATQSTQTHRDYYIFNCTPIECNLHGEHTHTKNTQNEMIIITITVPTNNHNWTIFQIQTKRGSANMLRALQYTHMSGSIKKERKKINKKRKGKEEVDETPSKEEYSIWSPPYTRWRKENRPTVSLYAIVINSCYF